MIEPSAPRAELYSAGRARRVGPAPTTAARRVAAGDTNVPKLLSEDAVAAFRRDGFLSPVRVMSRNDAAKYRRALEAHEAKAGQPLQGNWRHKTHLLFTWADELVHHPKIVDAVEDLL